MSAILINGVDQGSGVVSIGGVPQVVGLPGVLVDYADYDLLPSSGEYATLNRVAVWRDTSTEGSIWVPAYLRDWGLVTSLNTSTYTPGAPPANWAELLGGTGTVAVSGDYIRLDTGVTAGGYAYLQYTPPAGWTAGHDVVVVVRCLIVDPAGYHSHGVCVEFWDTRAGSTFFARFSPRDPSSSRGGIIKGDVESYVGATFAAQTTVKTYVLEFPGATANDLCVVSVVGDQMISAGGQGSGYSAAVASQRFRLFVYSLAGDRSIIDWRSINIYSRAG